MNKIGATQIIIGFILFSLGFWLFLSALTGNKTYNIPDYSKKHKTAKASKHDESTGMGVASLVLGIIGIFLIGLPIVGLIFPILAIVFANVQKGKNPTGVATAGLTIGIISIVLNIGVTLILVTTFIQYA